MGTENNASDNHRQEVDLLACPTDRQLHQTLPADHLPCALEFFCSGAPIDGRRVRFEEMDLRFGLGY